MLVYHKDGLGSVRVITDVNGDVIETYETDEFGVVTSASGTIEQPFGYTGEMRDAETGLVYLRARYYDSYLNRFIQSDPIVADMHNPLALNRYMYGLDNPLKYVDPSGLSSSQALKDGSADNDCFTSAGGALGGNVVSVTCLNMFGQTVAIGMVRAGNILVPVISVLPASPPSGGGSADLVGRLKPGGRLIGKEGTSSRIRIIRGGLQEAQALFDELAQGGQVVNDPSYRGTMVKFDDGGRIGLRPQSTSGPPTIDVFIAGLGIREIKFIP